MEYRTLISGDRIPMVGIGTFTLKDSACRESVRIALEEGYTHIDTAEAYRNQTEVAAAIKDVGIDRKALFITTKVGSGHLKYQDTLNACETTLRDLQTNYIDLYLIHWPNFHEATMEETFRALAELKAQGMIRNIGVSNFTVEHLKDALVVSRAPVTANQVEYHPFLNQHDILTYCDRHDIVVTAHSPVAQGKIHDNPTLQEIARNHDKTLVQIVLKWMVDKGIVVIPRSSTREHIRANLDLFSWELSPEVSAAIDSLEETVRLANPAHFDPSYTSRFT